MAEDTKRNLRVLMMLCDFRAGGAEVTALQLVRALSNRGYEFTVGSVRAGGVLADAFRDAGAEVIEGLARRRIDLVGFWRVLRLLWSRRIDVMVIVDVARNAMLYGLTGSILRGPFVRRVVWCKSVPGRQMGHFTGRLRRYRKARLIDAIVCTSVAQRGRLVGLGVPPQGIGLIRNGVQLPDDSATESPPAELARDCPVIVQVANCMPDKDHLTLIKAAGQLARRGKKFHLLLVGRDTDGQEMLHAVRSEGVESHVSLLGHRDDVRRILTGAYAFVMSTHSEVFSVATLEAMAAGLPVVVSDIPAFSEMFTSGREGIKVRPQDAGDMADALAMLLDDVELRNRIAAAARKRAERFSIARMADNFDRLLRTLARR